MKPCPRFSRLAAVSIIMLAVAGCEHTEPDQMARAVSAGEQPVSLEGSAAFFGGSINATVTISYGIGSGRKGPKAGKEYTKNISGMSYDEAEAYLKDREAIGSPLPPVTIHLKLENLLPGTVSVEIVELNSDLGNFAVEPAVLSLAPGQETEPDSMTSQLGVTSDDIPVVVTLKLAGKQETQTLQVRTIPPPPPAPAPPSP
jgi:hypothetical protein